jgi:hypothetical protein
LISTLVVGVIGYEVYLKESNFLTINSLRTVHHEVSGAIKIQFKTEMRDFIQAMFGLDVKYEGQKKNRSWTRANTHYTTGKNVEKRLGK